VRDSNQREPAPTKHFCGLFVFVISGCGGGAHTAWKGAPEPAMQTLNIYIYIYMYFGGKYQPSLSGVVVLRGIPNQGFYFFEVVHMLMRGPVCSPVDEM